MSSDLGGGHYRGHYDSAPLLACRAGKTDLDRQANTALRSPLVTRQRPTSDWGVGHYKHGGPPPGADLSDPVTHFRRQFLIARCASFEDPPGGFSLRSGSLRSLARIAPAVLTRRHAPGKLAGWTSPRPNGSTTRLSRSTPRPTPSRGRSPASVGAAGATGAAGAKTSPGSGAGCRRSNQSGPTLTATGGASND